MFCNFQTVFLIETQKKIIQHFEETLKVLDNFFVFLQEKVSGNHKTCLKIGFTRETPPGAGSVCELRKMNMRADEKVCMNNMRATKDTIKMISQSGN